MSQDLFFLPEDVSLRYSVLETRKLLIQRTSVGSYILIHVLIYLMTALANQDWDSEFCCLHITQLFADI